VETVFADKFGEVWRVSHDPSATPEFASGHFATLTGLKLYGDTLIITDKDSKIYVVEYPRMSVIR
jgi:hypothetical protein